MIVKSSQIFKVAPFCYSSWKRKKVYDDVDDDERFILVLLEEAMICECMKTLKECGLHSRRTRIGAG